MIEGEGWFADMDDEDKRDPRWPWRPFVQADNGCYPLPLWFESEDACRRFIKDHLTGLPILDD